MEVRGRDDLGSPNEQIVTVSDLSTDRLQSPPALLALPPSSRSSHRLTTNESVTTFEEESLPADSHEEGLQQPVVYAVEGRNVLVRSQVTRKDVFDVVSAVSEENTKRRPKRDQVSVKYKKKLDDDRRMSQSAKQEAGQDSSERYSQTCQNPAALMIQDLNSEESKAQVSSLKSAADKQHMLTAPTPAAAILKTLEAEKQLLAAELSKARTRAQLLEEENLQLARQADLVLNLGPNIGRVTVSTEVDSVRTLEFGTQMELLKVCAEESQTESDGTVARLEREKAEMLQRMAADTKRWKARLGELQGAKIGLETESRTILEKNAKQARALEELAAKLISCENTTARLEKEAESQRKFAEELKQESHKRGLKAKDAKKERDMIRIELLKLKQVYSEKCDGYREARNRLYRKLKQRDELIARLQTGGKPSPEETRKGPSSQTQTRCRSLENTRKNPIRDLSYTLQRDEFSGKLKQQLDDLIGANTKKFVRSERTSEGPKKIPHKEKLSAEKNKSFCSDEATTLVDPKSVSGFSHFP